jgi:hypothetical protein
MATMTPPFRLDLTRRLSRAAVLVDRIDAPDRIWLNRLERDRRQAQQEAKARRELRELRDRLNAMAL